MRLPQSLREQLRTPLGVLVPDNQADRDTVMSHLGDDPYLVTVGDRTTEKMMGFGLVPSLQIVDGTERRQKREYPEMPQGTAEIRVTNPPAQITEQSVESVKRSFSMTPPVRLTVDGEEDLLVLPACLHAPDGAIVMYGQPGEGLVIVRITAEIRNKTRSLLDLME